MLLALGAGLRRGEIDRLLWRHVDFAKSQIFIEESEHGGLKTRIRGERWTLTQAPLQSFGHIRRRQPGNSLSMRSRPSRGYSRTWGMRYRCVTVFEKVNAWLRAHGVEGAKALHTLRKEAGSIIASRDGIFAASQFLRHADIAVTAAHYADQKKRTVIDMGGLLNPEPVTPENVTPFPSGKSEAKKTATGAGGNQHEKATLSKSTRCLYPPAKEKGQGGAKRTDASARSKRGATAFPYSKLSAENRLKIEKALERQSKMPGLTEEPGDRF